MKTIQHYDNVKIAFLIFKEKEKWVYELCNIKVEEYSTSKLRDFTFIHFKMILIW